jgi:hypothetical protein
MRNANGVPIAMTHGGTRPDTVVVEPIRALLRHAQRRSAPTERTLESLLPARRVLVARSAGFSILGSFAGRLAALDRGVALTVLALEIDAADVRQVCPEGVEVAVCPGNGNFAWHLVELVSPSLLGAFDRHVFLTNNESAAGYDNLAEIMDHLSPGPFYAYTCSGRLLEFSNGGRAAKADAELARGLADWFWAQLDDPEAA